MKSYYKLRNKTTGLFHTPNGDHRTPQVSDDGKRYKNIPRLEWAGYNDIDNWEVAKFQEIEVPFNG